MCLGTTAVEIRDEGAQAPCCTNLENPGRWQQWYVRNDDDGDDIGPMAFDDVVARMREGSITPDTSIYGTSVTTGGRQPAT